MDYQTLPFPDIPFVAWDLVDPNRLRKSGCFTRFPVRLNQHDDFANRGMKRAYDHYSEATNTQIQSYDGAVASDMGNMVSFVYGDCLPKRLELMTYMTEIGFLHDDYTEVKDPAEILELHECFDYALDPSNLESPDNLPTSLKMKEIFAEVVLECCEINAQQALLLMKSYSVQWLKNVDTRPIPFSSIDEYLEYRVRDSGSLVFTWQVAFGQDTYMSEEEYETLDSLFRAAVKPMLLCNDFYSWQKERGHPHHRIGSAVFFYIKAGSSEKDALAKVKQDIIGREEHFLKQQHAFCEGHPNLPPRLKKMVNMLGPAIGGYHYWSSICPRYNSPEEKVPSLVGSLVVSDKIKRDAFTLSNECPQQPTRVHLAAERQAAVKTNGNTLRINPPSLDKSALHGPIEYIQSLGSKNVRSQLIDALNVWMNLPPTALHVVKNVVNCLHNSSLLLDDIQDGSFLRRGGTTTHIIFGQAQTINSATYMFVQATKNICSLKYPALMTVLIEELENLFIGQSWELKWRSNMCCPSEEEYFAMVDHKTGSMFRMILRFMYSFREPEHLSTFFNGLSTSMGRWYQVRDDYLNLVGTDYTKKKGFCEDLDEGKFSYPVVRCCADPTMRDILLGIIQRRSLPNLPTGSKQQVLGIMEKAGAIGATWELVRELQVEVEAELARLEVIFGKKNPIIRLLVKVLGEIPEPGKTPF